MNIVPKKELNVFDSTCIIVGIIIGAGIYETAPIVASCMASRTALLGIWLAGGVLAMTGALCYAELATAYPCQGGDCVYLKRAYGRWAGFLFGWSQLAIIRPGDIALMAFIFARYAQKLYPFAGASLVYAASAVIILTAINVIGVKEGKWTQNILTVIKVIGLLAIIAAGLFAPAAPAPPEPSGITMPGLQLALILVLFTYGGWNEMAYVAAEVKNPARNITRALVIGTCTVTVLYLFANAAFVHSLGYTAMTGSNAVAVDVVAKTFPGIAVKAVSVLICVSALGAINGLIFTGARISYAMGTDYAIFRRLGTWDKRSGTPIWALIAQGTLSTAIILLAGSFIDTIIYSAPIVWIFFFATAVSVFVLRRKDRQTPRPYKVTGYPVTTFVFCAACVFMGFSSISYALTQKPKGLIIMATVLTIGIAAFYLTDRSNSPKKK